MESQGQAIRGDVERYGRYTLSFRKGSGGELNAVFSLLLRLFRTAGEQNSHCGRMILYFLRCGLIMERIDARNRRLLELPFRRTRLSCLMERT